MAKRRSMNRRWSRRSGNNSAFLNDDTNVLEEDEGYWQHLHQTHSRPPSGVNITAATAVLDPDSNLMDSNASSSQWDLLDKSSENPSQRNPSKPSKEASKDASNTENLENPSATDSDVSAKIRKKRPLLRKPRTARTKNLLVLNSSESTAEINPRAAKSPKNSTSGVPTRVTSPGDSITSVESDKIQKRRPRFRKQVLKRLDKSTPGSDNSVVLPSQETRKTSIRPRSTFLNKSPAKKHSKSPRGAQEGTLSESGSEEIVSQPRKIFGRMRKFKVSENPFTGILDETEEGNASSINETRKSQAETNDSGNIVLQITPGDSQEQEGTSRESKKQRETSVSGSSLSEELKVSQPRSSGTQRSSGTREDEEDVEVEDSDDYHSLEALEADVPEEETVIGTSTDNQKDSRAEEGSEQEETLQEDVSHEVQGENQSRVSRQSRVESNDPSVHSAVAPEEAEDNQEEETAPKNTSRSTRSVTSRSSRSKGLPSPIISGSAPQEVSQQEKSLDQTDKTGKTRKPLIQEVSLISEEEESIKNKSETNQRRSEPKSQVLQRKNDSEVHGDDDNDEDVILESTKKGEISKKQEKPKPSVSSRSSRSKGQDKEQTIDSEDETDEESVSGDVSLFSPNKSDVSGSKVVSPPTKNLNSITENGKSRKIVPEKTPEAKSFTRPGPKSSKLSIRSSDISSIQSPKEAEKSTGDESLRKSNRPGPRSSKSFLEVPSDKKQPEDVALPEDEEIQRRPGPKSFKRSQRSLLANSRVSNASKTSVEVPETPQKSKQTNNETESLSESSTRKEESSRMDPSLYELPPQERTASIIASGSEEDSGTESPQKSGKSKRRIQSEDEEDQPPAKKTLNASPRTSKRLTSVVPQEKMDENTVPEHFDAEPTPSTSSGAPATAEQKKKLRQLKIDALMRHNKPQSQTPSAPFDPEEFKKKLAESKKVLERMRAKEEEASRKIAEKKREEMAKKVPKGFKGLQKGKKPEKIVDRAFIVNGKVYKRPKLPRPKHWATDKFYKFLWRKMEPKFGDQYRVKSEKFVVELNEVMTVIMRRKKFDNYKEELEGLLKKMAQLGIIETRYDFNGFCYDFLPFEFRIKVVPMLQAGNTHNIPFEPEKLMEPILG